MFAYDLEEYDRTNKRKKSTNYLKTVGDFQKNRKDLVKELEEQNYQYFQTEVNTRKKNVAMAYIGYKKAYNMIQKTWIIECLKIFKISWQVINLIMRAMNDIKIFAKNEKKTRNLYTNH